MTDVLVTRVERRQPTWSTLTAALCLVLVSIGLGVVGVEWSRVALGLMSTQGDDFWWGFDAIFAVIAGVIVLVVAVTVLMAALFGLYTSRRLFQRVPGSRSHAIYVFLLGILVFFARSYTSPAMWVAGIAIGSAGAVLLLLPSTSGDFVDSRAL